MTAWEVQMQFSHVLGHVVHFVITDSKWDTHIQDCPSMWYIYIYVTYRYTVAISRHTVLNNTQEFWVPGLGDLHAPRWDLRNRPTSMACTPCESKKMWRNWRRPTTDQLRCLVSLEASTVGCSSFFWLRCDVIPLWTYVRLTFFLDTYELSRKLLLFGVALSPDKT